MSLFVGSLEENRDPPLAVPLSGGEALLLDASGGTVLLQQLQAASVALESVRPQAARYGGKVGFRRTRRSSVRPSDLRLLRHL